MPSWLSFVSHSGIPTCSSNSATGKDPTQPPAHHMSLTGSHSLTRSPAHRILELLSRLESSFRSSGIDGQDDRTLAIAAAAEVARELGTMADQFRAGYTPTFDPDNSLQQIQEQIYQRLSFLAEPLLPPPT